MITVRCIKTGAILGYAADSIVAYELAKANGWTSWYVEPTPEPTLVDEPASCDPRNTLPNHVR